jgi:hypothetical protein
VTLPELLSLLHEVRARGHGRYAARCPAHGDTTPSLSISEGESAVLVRCFAGCTVAEISAALGLTVGDLFFDRGRPAPLGHRPAPTPPRVDRLARAFQFELVALDLRVRAVKIIETGKALDMEHLSDDERDQAMNAAAKAHNDRARAELLEQVSDTLRERDLIERNTRERQTCVA